MSPSLERLQSFAAECRSQIKAQTESRIEMA
jgi:hypothetical protein